MHTCMRIFQQRFENAEGCATLSRAHFRAESETPCSFFYNDDATRAMQLHRRGCIWRKVTESSSARHEVLGFVSSFSLFSLHFSVTLAEKRIKSGNEGCKAPGSFLPRQSHSAGSFTLSLRAVECPSAELRLAIAPVDFSPRMSSVRFQHTRQLFYQPCEGVIFLLLTFDRFHVDILMRKLQTGFLDS